MRSTSTSAWPASGSATIHNFAHQGICGEHVLWETGLTRPGHFFDGDRLRDNFNHGALNLMKGGIVYSNFITTVSPQHAWEATRAGKTVRGTAQPEAPWRRRAAGSLSSYQARTASGEGPG